MKCHKDTWKDNSKQKAAIGFLVPKPETGIVREAD